mgnify:CR=1 FL=1
MIATTIGLSVRVWLAISNPDNDVHTALGIYPDIGEWFINTSNGALFLCKNGSSGSQEWQVSTNTSLVQSIIASSVLQSNWTEVNTSNQDYIKNKPVLASVSTSGSYNDLINTPTIPAAQVQSNWTQVLSTSLDFIKNKPTLAVVATTGSYSDLIGKPTLATVATSGSYNDLSNKPTIPAAQIQSDWTQTNSSNVDYIKNKPASKSQSAVSRALNTIFQISATRDTQVVYSVDITCVSTLLGGQAGVVFLEISPSSTFSSGIQEICSFTNANSVALAIAITVTQTNTAVLSSHLIPAGYYVRLRTSNTTGTPTFLYRSGQEVII